MKTRKNQQSYRLPPFGVVLNVTLRPYPMGPHQKLLHLREYAEKNPPPGTPRYFTIEDSKILLWPTPDKAYEFSVRFYPPAQEV
jgi:hypothetical protein